MKALVYRGTGQPAWEETATPTVQDPTDAVVRVDAVTICGSDLHILKGDLPEVTSGRVLGHEAVGTITEVGPAVRGLVPGDRVLVSCISGCGLCVYCRTGTYGQCVGGGGWILGHTIDGTQAEYVRTPFADTSLYKVPDTLHDESALLLADILPTAYEVGVLNGRIRPGDTVLIVGAGPVGLAAIATARLFSPARIIAVDPAPGRRDAAKRLGADVALDTAEATPDAVRDLSSDGRGVDVAIEAVGLPETFDLCTQAVRPGGRVANVGVHGRPTTLHLEELWTRNLTITTGLVDTSSTPRLLSMLAAGQLEVPDLITHRFALHDMLTAYEAFGDAANNGALKVALFLS